MGVGKYDNWADDFSKTVDYDKEILLMRIANHIEECMQHRSLRNTDMANLLEKSRSYVTQILRGDVNFTMDRLLQIAKALDCHLVVPQFIPSETPASVRRIYTYANKVCWESTSKYKAEESVFYSVGVPNSNTMLAEAS